MGSIPFCLTVSMSGFFNPHKYGKYFLTRRSQCFSSFSIPISMGSIAASATVIKAGTFQSPYVWEVFSIVLDVSVRRVFNPHTYGKYLGLRELPGKAHFSIPIRMGSITSYRLRGTSRRFNPHTYGKYSKSKPETCPVTFQSPYVWEVSMDEWEAYLRRVSIPIRMGSIVYNNHRAELYVVSIPIRMGSIPSHRRSSPSPLFQSPYVWEVSGLTSFLDACSFSIPIRMGSIHPLQAANEGRVFQSPYVWEVFLSTRDRVHDTCFNPHTYGKYRHSPFICFLVNFQSPYVWEVFKTQSIGTTSLFSIPIRMGSIKKKNQSRWFVLFSIPIRMGSIA